MKKTTLLLLAIVSLIVVFALSSCKQREEAGKGEVTMEDVKKETKEAAETAGQYAMQKKEEYQKALEDKLEAYDEKIDDLSAMAGKAIGDAKTEMEKSIDELKAKRDSAAEKLDELRGSSGEAWEDMKTGMDKAMDDIEKAYEEAKSRFK